MDCLPADPPRSERPGRPARPLRRRARRHGSPGRAAQPRRLPGAIHAGLQPRQMASGAHHLVFETFLLSRHAPGYRAFHPSYRMLFNSYYNAIGARHPRPQRGLLTRPDLAEVRYREHVDEAMRALARQAGDAAFDALLALGLNHEQQHQELILTDVKHLLYANPPAGLRGQRRPALPPATPAGWTEYAGGVTRIGHDGGGFAFDNEAPAHDAAGPLSPGQPAGDAARIPGLHPRRRLFTAGAVAIAGMGPRLRGGLARRSWEGERDDWQVFTLHGMQELELQAPVTHVSYFEADAYARWAGSGCRASPNGNPPRAASLTAAPACTPTCWKAATWIRGPRPPGQAGRAPPSLRRRLGVDQQRLRGLSRLPPGQRRGGRIQRQIHVQSYVLRGGSCVTPRSHIRPATAISSRPRRWQFSGIRLARDA